MADFQISEEDRIFIGNLIGIPYEKFGVEKSFDCWTLIKHIYKHHGIELPTHLFNVWNLRVLDKEIKNDANLWDRIDFNDRKYLDLILFNTSYRFSTHIGLTIDKKWFIHAVPTSGVVLDRFNKGIHAALIKWVYRWKNI